MITGMEYAFGLAFNRAASDLGLPAHAGQSARQICLPFTLPVRAERSGDGGMRMLKP